MNTYPVTGISLIIIGLLTSLIFLGLKIYYLLIVTVSLIIIGVYLIREADRELNNPESQESIKEVNQNGRTE